ncbi:chromosome partitioning protein [Lentzea aerocolonigenes]|uniref:chromosome partitioning protein n=1 Tax=Lentzea aerocolonigenes TaxID=68170 RepID=UPI00068EAF87|nr:chromosome partitioning protein [Lentzea aerocolonigenes]MCP2243321.1 hypothetical protein [Lentzea aerocolonigenes]
MLIAVVSFKGSPGVTTLSLALAAQWPGPVRAVLVEADPSGGDIATRFCLPSSPGLLSLAAAARGSTDPGLLWQHTQALPGGLPVVTAPPDADLTRGALLTLTSGSPAAASVVRASAGRAGVVVIADCGRVDHASAALSVVREADALVLLTGARADDLAHLARSLPTAGSWTPRPVLLLAGDGYSTADVGRELGVMPMGRVPHDPRGAAVLCGRPPRSRWRGSRPSHSALGRFAHKLAAGLAQRVVVAPHLSLINGASAGNELPRTPGLPVEGRPGDYQLSWKGAL